MPLDRLTGGILEEGRQIRKEARDVVVPVLIPSHTVRTPPLPLPPQYRGFRFLFRKPRHERIFFDRLEGERSQSGRAVDFFPRASGLKFIIVPVSGEE